MVTSATVMAERETSTATRSSVRAGTAARPMRLAALAMTTWLAVGVVSGCGVQGDAACATAAQHLAACGSQLAVGFVPQCQADPELASLVAEASCDTLRDAASDAKSDCGLDFSCHLEKWKDRLHQAAESLGRAGVRKELFNGAQRIAGYRATAHVNVDTRGLRGGDLHVVMTCRSDSGRPVVADPRTIENFDGADEDEPEDSFWAWSQVSLYITYDRPGIYTCYPTVTYDGTRLQDDKVGLSRYWGSDSDGPEGQYAERMRRRWRVKAWDVDVELSACRIQGSGGRYRFTSRLTNNERLADFHLAVPFDPTIFVPHRNGDLPPYGAEPRTEVTSDRAICWLTSEDVTAGVLYDEGVLRAKQSITLTCETEAPDPSTPTHHVQYSDDYYFLQLVDQRLDGKQKVGDNTCR